MCSSGMRKMICTLGEHERDQTSARQESVKEDGARKNRAVFLRRWWLTIARTHEGDDSGLEQCQDMKAEKRCGILSTFPGGK